MNIVFMNGGLGNQLFQYIFSRWLERKTGERCVIDDSPFFGEQVPHNGYELENIFGIHLQRLSSFFDRKTWDWMVAQRVGVNGVAQQLLDAGMDLKMVHEDAASLHFSGQIISCNNGKVPLPKGDVYYHGYWLGNTFMQEVQDVLMRELVFPSFTDARNIGYMQEILANESVAIHIRRGDMAEMGLTSGTDFFSRAIAKMVSLRPNASYFLFSDDMDWCQEHAAALGLDQSPRPICFIKGNQGTEAYRDLQLMSCCRHIIADKSSFSLLAGLWDCQEGDMRIWRWDT